MSMRLLVLCYFRVPFGKYFFKEFVSNLLRVTANALSEWNTTPADTNKIFNGKKIITAIKEEPASDRIRTLQLSAACQ